MVIPTPFLIAPNKTDFQRLNSFSVDTGLKCYPKIMSSTIVTIMPALCASWTVEMKLGSLVMHSCEASIQLMTTKRNGSVLPRTRSQLKRAREKVRCPCKNCQLSLAILTGLSSELQSEFYSQALFCLSTSSSILRQQTPSLRSKFKRLKLSKFR